MSAVIEASVVSIEKPQLSEGDVTKRTSLLERVKSLKIVDQPSYDVCVEIGKAAHALTKIVDERHDPAVKQAFQLHKTLVANKKADLEPIEEAKKIAGAKIRVWDDEQARIRQAREAEERRKAVAAQAEADRIEAERVAAEKKRIEDERLELAMQIEAEGASTEAVAAILEEPVYVAPAPVQQIISQQVAPTYAKASGVSSGGFNYSVEIVSLPDLVAFAVTLPAQLLGQFVEAAEKSLNNMARDQKDLFCVPGVRLVKEPKRASFR